MGDEFQHLPGGCRRFAAAIVIMFSRDRKTPIAEWWWTVDRELLVALVLLIVCGIVLSFAASPSVAERLHLPWYFFILRQCGFAHFDRLCWR